METQTVHPNDVLSPSEGEAPATTLIAWQSRGFRKRRWTVRLTPDAAEFTCSETGESIIVPREQARRRITIPQGLLGLITNVVTVRGEDKKKVELTLEAGGKSLLNKWVPPKSAADMSKELRDWGIGLVVLGVLHFVLPRFLEPVWGGIILVIGVLNLLIRRRGMFIVNGITLIVAGVWNIASVCHAFSAWVIFGLLQIGLGVHEIRKYAQYATVRANDGPPGVGKRS